MQIDLKNNMDQVIVIAAALVSCMLEDRKLLLCCFIQGIVVIQAIPWLRLYAKKLESFD